MKLFIVIKASKYESIDEINEDSINSEYLEPGRGFERVISKEQAKRKSTKQTKYLEKSDFIGIFMNY